MSFSRVTTVIFFMLLKTLYGVDSEIRPSVYETNCSVLLVGQYWCPSPEIDPLTQQPKGCGRNNIANSKLLLKYLVNVLTMP